MTVSERLATFRVHAPAQGPADDRRPVSFNGERDALRGDDMHDRSLHLPIRRGLLGRCPACGEGKLFQGFLTLRPRCDHCGLDYAFADSGDGPAVFVILFAGFVVVFAALAVEFAYQPPYWVHALLWLPLIALTTLAPLRPLKGLMIALQYHHQAAEGRRSRDDRP
jgi:uncharacterized protein (DUF983 family)